MYQRFKNCLLKPKNIADYIKEPNKLTIIYTTILLIVYVIPFVLISLLSTSVETSLSTKISDEFINSAQINYNIENGKLVSTNEVEVPQYVESEYIVYNLYKVDVLYVFDTTGSSYQNILNVEEGTYLVFLFTENDFSILAEKVKKESTNGNVEVVSFKNTASNNNRYTYLNYTYSELGLNNILLSSNKDNNTINFKNDIATLVSSIYNKIKMKLLPLIIIFVIMLAVGSYFFSVLFITLIFKLLYRYLQVDFGIVFKTTILSSTPYIICSILCILTSISFLEIVGEFIMILYVTKAITAYKIKYDGGIPLPKYMMNFMDEKKEEEKGSGDDEL